MHSNVLMLVKSYKNMVQLACIHKGLHNIDLDKNKLVPLIQWRKYSSNQFVWCKEETELLVCHCLKFYHATHQCTIIVLIFAFSLLLFPRVRSSLLYCPLCIQSLFSLLCPFAMPIHSLQPTSPTLAASVNKLFIIVLAT